MSAIKSTFTVNGERRSVSTEARTSLCAIVVASTRDAVAISGTVRGSIKVNLNLPLPARSYSFSTRAPVNSDPTKPSPTTARNIDSYMPLG